MYSSTIIVKAPAVSNIIVKAPAVSNIIVLGPTIGGIGPPPTGTNFVVTAAGEYVLEGTSYVIESI